MINLYSNVYMDANDSCYTVFEYNGKLDKKGNKVVTNTKYYTDFNHLFQALFTRMNREAVNTSSTLEELKNKIEQNHKTIESICSRIDKVNLKEEE